MSAACEAASRQMEGSQMGFFERYLTLWVALCIVAGIVLGHFLPSAFFLPGLFQTIGKLEIAQVNLPVAVLIWLMIIPMLVKIDFAALREVGQYWRGIGVTLLINWGIKPFSMALLGWLFVGGLFAPLLPPDQIESYIAGLILLAAAPPAGRCTLHRDGVRVEQSHQRRAALHPEPGGAERRDHGVRFRPHRRLAIGIDLHRGAVADLAAVGGALHRHSATHRPNRAQRDAEPAGRDRVGAVAGKTRPVVFDRSADHAGAAVWLSRPADRETAAGDPAAGATDPVPSVFQRRVGLLAQPQSRLAALRGRPFGLDRRQQLLRAGGGDGDRAVRLRVGRGAGDRGRGADRGAGDAGGGRHRQSQPPVVRTGIEHPGDRDRLTPVGGPHDRSRNRMAPSRKGWPHLPALLRYRCR